MIARTSINDQLSFSKLVYGYWRANEWGFSTEDTLDHIKFCLDLGITTFDHADIYGDYTCEKIFGDALKKSPELRQKLEIVTKCGIKLVSTRRPNHEGKYYDTSYDHIIWSAENSLRELGTDYIDVLLIHRPDPFNDPAETARAFEKLKADGKVLHFGVSNYTIQQFKTLSAHLPFKLVTNQLEISAQCLDSFDDGNISFCQEIGLKPMAWSPLGGGSIFSSQDEQNQRLRKTLEKVASELGAAAIDQVLLSWLLTHPAGIVPVLGTGKKDRIKSSVDAATLAMTRVHWFEILEASRGAEIP